MNLEGYKAFKAFLTTIKVKKKLLLHSCCGPCSSYVIDFLHHFFDITIYYSNSNIYPQEEFQRRVETQEKLLKELPYPVALLVDDYEPSFYYEAVKGYEDLPEGSKRCYYCYAFRMERTACYAKEHGYDYFTTTLSISPHKNATFINEIGQELSEKYGIPFLYSDFKKEEGYKKSIILAKEHQLYRQDYCGCVYSWQEREHQHEG